MPRDWLKLCNTDDDVTSMLQWDDVISLLMAGNLKTPGY